MKKYIIMLALAALALLQAQAVPAYPGLITLTQPDGTQLQGHIRGDEFYHYFTTADGYTVVKNAAGYYTYAQLSGGTLTPTATVARDASVRTAADQALLTTLGKNLTDRQQVNAARKARTDRDGQLRRAGYNYKGFRGLIILVNFNDCQFTRSDANDFYNKMVNQKGYTGYTNEDGTRNNYGSFTGSVRDYYEANSNGIFAPTFDIVGPVTVPYSVDYPQSTSTSRMRSIMSSALQQARSLCNFADYDTDGDGYIDMIYYIFAGVGSNTGESSTHVWPHASYYTYSVGGGLYTGRYACSTEYYSERYGILDGIGTICHEFSHVLGLPDLYDTDYSGTGGESNVPGEWEIMSGGSYNNYSRTPAGYSAYDRYSLGFMNPVVIDAAGSYTLGSLQTANQAYRINTPVANEYFLLENRQKTDWDAALPGHGMLVMRVDSTNSTVWRNNTVNCDPAHNYYEMVRAGNGNKSEDASDPFPGTTGNTTLTSATTPSLKTWNGTETQWALTGISETGGVIKFNVSGEVLTDVEDFEGMATTSNTGLKDVEGNFAQWTFTRSNVMAPGAVNCNGSHAVAMKLPAAFRCSDTYYDAYQVSYTVYNNTSAASKWTLSYSTDGGSTWTAAQNASGDNSQTVAANTSITTNWKVNAKKETATQYRVNMTSGSRTAACYVDDFTIYYNAKGEKPQVIAGDVNGDGVVDTTDVTALVSYILGTDTSYTNVDIDGDGQVNTADVTALVNLVLAK